MSQKKSSDLVDRQPPFDLPAETGVLGSLILLPSLLDEVSTCIGPEDFYDQAHGAIFAAMLWLAQHEKPLDVTLLIDRLKGAGKLEVIGGTAYLSRIVNSISNAAHALYYAEIVAEKAAYRRMIEAATQLLKDAYDQAAPPHELQAEAESRLAGIAAKSSQRFSLVSLGQAANRVIEGLIQEREGDEVNRAGFGLRVADDLLGPIMGGEVCIVAARPGMGKTAFIQHVLRSQDAPSLLVSLEMTADEIATRELCRVSGVDSRHVRTGKVGPNDLSKLSLAGDELNKVPVWLWDPQKASLSEIRSIVSHAVGREGVLTVAIDFIQLMEGEGREIRREALAMISRGLKRLAKEFRVPLFVCCQLNREADEKEPTMGMLRECGAIEESADCILFLHTGPADDKRKLIVGKFRQGSIGTVTLDWNSRRTEFVDDRDSQKQIF